MNPRGSSCFFVFSSFFLLLFDFCLINEFGVINFDAFDWWGGG
jgi:hypothetical protein